jgi:hypothetical protein
MTIVIFLTHVTIDEHYLVLHGFNHHFCNLCTYSLENSMFAF